MTASAKSVSLFVNRQRDTHTKSRPWKGTIFDCDDAFNSHLEIPILISVSDISSPSLLRLIWDPGATHNRESPGNIPQKLADIYPSLFPHILWVSGLHVAIAEYAFRSQCGLLTINPVLVFHRWWTRRRRQTTYVCTSYLRCKLSWSSINNKLIISTSYSIDKVNGIPFIYKLSIARKLCSIIGELCKWVLGSRKVVWIHG